MFNETGQNPSVCMSLTPNEFSFLFPLTDNADEPLEKFRKMAIAHRNQNDRRGKSGLIPKLSDEFRLRIEGKR